MTLAFENAHLAVHQGDCRDVLPQLARGSVQACITSPPYWQARDYGVPNEIGQEPDVDDYVDTLRSIFSEVMPILKPGGVLLLNLGDARAGSGYANHRGTGGRTREQGGKARHTPTCRLPPKSLFGVPWRVALALQADGWILRSAIVWRKEGAQPNLAKDRPASVYEHIFLFAADASYYWRDPAGLHTDVWSLPVQSYHGDHPATMPMPLAMALVDAATRPGDLILDPFAGALTTANAATLYDRRAVCIEPGADYIEEGLQRIGLR